MIIHKQGFKTISFITIITIILNSLIFTFINNSIITYSVLTISSLPILFSLFFFRNPNRIPLINENAIISPADGTVVVIEKTNEDEYFKDKRIQVSIFMSAWNVHSNRMPISGKIIYKKYHPGLFLLARNPKSSTENERTTTVIETNNNFKVLIRQIAGIVARRIVTSIEIDDNIKQGEEIGFIKFGSRVDILLPLDSKIKVNIGDKVRASKSIIAEIS